MPIKRHLLITGTGRSGTTFLVQLLTQLGQDTGFTDPWPARYLDPQCNAGMEWNLRAANAPYVVKSPSLCTELETILLGGKVMIEHVLIPVRDLFSKLQPRLGDCSYAKFEAAFSLIAKPQLVHQFADAVTFRKCAVG